MDFSFPCYNARAEHRPPCGHRLVLSLCLCLLRHSSATSHHHHVGGTRTAPLHLQRQQSPQRDPCLTASLKNAPQVSESAVSSHPQGSVGLLCPAHKLLTPGEGLGARLLPPAQLLGQQCTEDTQKDAPLSSPGSLQQSALPAPVLVMHISTQPGQHGLLPLLRVGS